MTSILTVDGINSWYGKSHILQDITFAVEPGETIALLGRNGAGKTTTLRSIMGLMPKIEGSITFRGEELVGQQTYDIAAMGIALVPENRGIFATLSVAENLAVAARRKSHWRVTDVLLMFPKLQQRWKTPGGKLSGGEQQMLAIARALLQGPVLLLLDEPTEGLAPIIVDQLVEIIRELKAAGLSIVLVEQNLEVCRKLADRHIIVDQGRVVWGGTTEALDGAGDVVARHLALDHA